MDPERHQATFATYSDARNAGAPANADGQSESDTVGARGV